MAKWRDRRPSDYGLPSTDDMLKKIRRGAEKAKTRHVLLKEDGVTPMSEQQDRAATEKIPTHPSVFPTIGYWILIILVVLVLIFQTRQMMQINRIGGEITSAMESVNADDKIQIKLDEMSGEITNLSSDISTMNERIAGEISRFSGQLEDIKDQNINDKDDDVLPKIDELQIAIENMNMDEIRMMLKEILQKIEENGDPSSQRIDEKIGESGVSETENQTNVQSSGQ